MTGIVALAVAFVFSQFYRAFLAVLTPFLAADLGATKADFSLASGLWFISFALFQFPVGIWLDRYGPRWTTSLLFAVAALGSVVFAMATAPWMMILAMILMGIGCSAILMGAIFLIARNYPPARMAMFTSWVVAFGSAGNVLSTTPLAAAAQAFGWRPVMLALGAVTLLTAVAIVALVRNPDYAEGRNSTGLAGYLELLRIRDLWPMFPLMLVGYTAVSGIRGLWVGPYVSDTFAVDAVVLGNVTLALALAMVAGTFMYGPLDALFRTRKWVIVGGQLVCASSLVTLSLNVDASLGLSTILLMMVGISGVGFGMILSHGREFLPPHLVGRGVTFMNFCSIGGGGMMQLVTGGVVTAATVPGDPGNAYSTLFGFYATASLTALCIYLFARDVKPGTSARRR